MEQLTVLRNAGSAFWLRATAWAVAVALVLAVPSVLIATPLFSRMTPTTWWEYILLGVAAVLSGLVMATRRLPSARACRVEGKAMTGGGLTYIAIACPICNKIVVAALGISGALTYFAPLQPVIGIGGIVVLIVALRRLLKAAGSDVTGLPAEREGDMSVVPSDTTPLGDHPA